MTSKAQIRATNKYNKKAYYMAKIVFPKNMEETVKARAAEKGLSLSAYVIDLIKKDMNI